MFSILIGQWLQVEQVGMGLYVKIGKRDWWVGR